MEKDAQCAPVPRRNGVKRKHECTPEEWAETLRKQREQRLKRIAEGRQKARTEEQKQRDRITRIETDRKRQLNKSPEAEASRQRTRERSAEWKRKARADGRLKYVKADLSPEQWTRRLESQRRWQQAQKAKRKWQDRRPNNEPIKNLALNDPAYAAIWKAIGFHHERDEIASEAYIALLEGVADNVEAAVAEGKRRHYRLFSPFRVHLSMDEPRYTDGRETLHDVIAAYVPEPEEAAEEDDDWDAPDPDIYIGDLGHMLIEANRRAMALRQAA